VSANTAVNSTAGAAGLYGAGGGAANAAFSLGVGTTSTSGAGRNGLIIIKYTPIPVGFNMPMLGM
jgi:hypothetical protein